MAQQPQQAFEIASPNRIKRCPDQHLFVEYLLQKLEQPKINKLEKIVINDDDYYMLQMRFFQGEKRIFWDQAEKETLTFVRKISLSDDVYSQTQHKALILCGKKLVIPESVNISNLD